MFGNVDAGRWEDDVAAVGLQFNAFTDLAFPRVGRESQDVVPTSPARLHRGAKGDVLVLSHEVSHRRIATVPGVDIDDGVIPRGRGGPYRFGELPMPLGNLQRARVAAWNPLTVSGDLALALTVPSGFSEGRSRQGNNGRPNAR